MNAHTSPRACEWECRCQNGSAIRAASLSECPKCGSKRPDATQITLVTDRTRVVLEALEELDRLSRAVGRFQAMDDVLRRFGGIS